MFSSDFLKLFIVITRKIKIIKGLALYVYWIVLCYIQLLTHIQRIIIKATKEICNISEKLYRTNLISSINCTQKENETKKKI